MFSLLSRLFGLSNKPPQNLESTQIVSLNEPNTNPNEESPSAIPTPEVMVEIRHFKDKDGATQSNSRLSVPDTTQPENPAEPTPENTTENSTENQTETPHTCTASLTDTGEINFCGLMLEQTIEFHLSFVNELPDVLSGKIPENYSPDIIGSVDLCKLGKWLNQQDKALAKFPAYAELQAAHHAFHDCAAEVVALHQEGKFTEAAVKRKQELKILSERTVEALKHLYEENQNLSS